MNEHKSRIWRGTFFFDPTDRIYNDHFPSYPVVPGSLIVKAFFNAIDNAEGEQRISVVRNFRFIRFVTPGEYQFRITRKKDHFFCELFNQEQEILVTGKACL